jgi:RNA polymerase sigma-70 factor, ECF subfamily
MSVQTASFDSELIQRVYENDSKALETLYDRYSPLLYTIIKKIVADEEIAKEVLCDIFVIIWKKVDFFDFNSNNVYAWLVTIARNKAVDVIRRTSNSSEMAPYNDEYENKYILPNLSRTIEPLDIDTADSIKEEIELALNKLTDSQQYVIYLAYYLGLTQEEIAVRLNIPVSTVKSKIKIAFCNLRNNLLQGKL